ncbi:galactokinase [Corynebacterium sp. BCW_4722]|nr:galactokinase [Corynebacterium sp. BCW_4722]
MARYVAPDTAPVERAREAHRARTGADPKRVASAPGTWVLIGENVDHFGGVTLAGTASLRAAAAFSERDDDVISIAATSSLGDTFEAQTTLAELSDGTPQDPLARRWAGLVQTLIQRQLLSRDTAGLDITIAGDVPLGAGLGALYACDCAIALALAGGSEEVDTAPFRTRLAEVCSHAVATYSSLALLRARHTVALRGGEQISVVDYADGSLTQAPSPSRHGARVFSLATELGRPHDRQKEAIAARRDFIDAAAANFGVTSLRQLPENVERVVQWVNARSEAGDETAPEAGVARSWVQFCETETLRSLAAAKALRSRRGNELFTLLNSPSEQHDLETPDALVALARERGAQAARPAATGTSDAVIAFVPLDAADDFAEGMAAEFEVVEVLPGEVARVDEAAP